MNHEFASLIDQLAVEVDRLRKEVARLRDENARLSETAASTPGIFNDISDSDRRALRHQVIEHIRKIDQVLGDKA